MSSKRKSFAIYFMGTGNTNECGRINALYNVHNNGILTHCEGDGHHLLLLARVSADNVVNRGGTSYLFSYGEIYLLGFLGDDLSGKCLTATDEDALNYHGADPGGNNTEQGVNQVADYKETEDNRSSVNYENNGRALPFLNILAEDEGENINAARRAAAKEGQGAARTDAKTAEERAYDQGDIA